jgi:hypothetical protein
MAPTSRLCAALITCGVLVACSRAGSPHRTAHASSRSPSASAAPAAIALTDRHTIDPCSLVPPSTLARSGRVAQGQSDSGLLACDMSVTMADHGVAGVYATLDDTTRCQIARKVAARAWSRLPR